MSSPAPLRIVFFGSDAIALRLLDWFDSEAGRLQAEIVAVFTQPDRPVGRGQKITANAIKTWALAHTLPVLQPEKLDDSSRAELAALKKKGDKTDIYTLPMHFGKSMIGTTGGEAIPHEDIPRYMSLTAARGIDLNDLITEIAPLDAINDLIKKMRNGTSAGRCLVDLAS